MVRQQPVYFFGSRLIGVTVGPRLRHRCQTFLVHGAVNYGNRAALGKKCQRFFGAMALRCAAKTSWAEASTGRCFTFALAGCLPR